jgi:hypothetical protein
MTGYLATLDSYEEYAFIRYQLRARWALISANDTKSEGVWVTGPTPSSKGGAATVLPWAQGEPSGGTSDNCAAIAYYGLFGTYCALFGYSGLYVIEYECASPKVLANGACISAF